MIDTEFFSQETMSQKLPKSDTATIFTSLEKCLGLPQRRSAQSDYECEMGEAYSKATKKKTKRRKWYINRCIKRIAAKKKKCMLNRRR